jgi:hypothetical protein
VAKIQISTFQGIAPRIDARLLKESQGQIGENLRLTSLALQSWRESVAVDSPVKTGAFSTIYLYKGSTPDVWLGWPTTVHVVKAPISADTTERIYWTGDGKPKAADNADNTVTGIVTTGGNNQYPEHSISLGVPAPTTALTAAIGWTLGAGTDPKDVVYVYTFVTQWGEESAPSPASNIIAVDFSDGDADLSGIETSYAAEYNTLSKIRIYRSLSGVNTSAFQLLAEINPASTYTDNTSDLDLGDIIESTDYDQPPIDMFGLLDFGNGILVGFTENDVCFCEPFLPHAWPIKYRISLQQKIVGGGVFGNTIVVCTDDQPVLVVGNHPSTMTMTVHPDHQACVSAQSIVQMRGSVVWASPNGLFQVGYGGSKLLTEPLYDRETWQQRNPAQLRATHWDTRYIGFTDDAGLVVETANGVIAASDFNIDVDALYTDPNDGALYISQSDVSGNNTILGFNIGGLRIPYKWRSKKVSLGSQATLTAGKILAKYGDLYTADEIAALSVLAASIVALNDAIVTSGRANGELNGRGVNVFDVNGSDIAEIPEVPTIQNVVLTLYADGVEIGSAAANSDKPFRLPSGYRARQFEIEIETYTDVNQITLASSIQDLL